MGDRYYLNPKCPFCEHIEDEDYYYAPTSGFMTHICESCGKEIDLEKLSGIDAELTASTEYGVRAIRERKDKFIAIVKEKIKKIKESTSSSTSLSGKACPSFSVKKEEKL